MVPGKYNMICPQGATFDQKMTIYIDDEFLNPFNYSAKMQVRETHDNENVLIELSTSSNTISLTTFGQMILNIDASVTANFKPGKYVYDIELTYGTTVDRILEGTFTVTPEVTR